MLQLLDEFSVLRAHTFLIKLAIMNKFLKYSLIVLG
mgnify:CR=1 FL=1